MRLLKFLISVILIVSAVLLFSSEIHDAVENSNLELVKELLKENESLLEEKNELGLTPFNKAAVDGNLGLVKFFAGKGADINTGDREGSNALHNASAGGHYELSKYLVDDLKIDINAVDNNRQTALHFATGSGNADLVKFLVEKGADVNARNYYEGTPLAGAVLRPDLELVKYLVEKGADPLAANRFDVSILHIASSRSDLATVKYLIEKGADPWAISQRGEYPLVWAVVRGNFEVADFYFDMDFDINHSYQEGRKLIHLMANGRVNSIEYLLGKGADINSVDDNGSTLLHEIVWGRNIDAIRFLLEKGADVNIVNESGRTPLMNSVYTDSLAIAELLINYGAKSNIAEVCNTEDCNPAKDSPLLMAAQRGQFDFAKLFLDNGADPNYQSNDTGVTAMHLAAEKGFTDIAELIMRYKSDINIKNNDGKTPLYLAKKHGNMKIAELLSSKKGKSSKLAKIDRKDLLNKKIGENEAYFWYMNHSGWAVKTKNNLLVFDYWEPERSSDEPSILNGCIDPEEIKELNVTVFASHDHGDHYSPIIFDWIKDVKNINYVMGFEPNGIDKSIYVFTAPRTTKELEGIKITTIESNDGGVGFVVEVDGNTIFHAGDHANRNRDLSGNYLPEIEFLNEKFDQIDIAMMPISGCGFGDQLAVKNGVYRTLEILNPKVFIPMHSSGNEHRYQTFIDEAKENGHKMEMKAVKSMGDRFHFKKGKIS